MRPGLQDCPGEGLSVGRDVPTVLPCYCATVRSASRVISKIYDEALRPSGLQISQYTVLEFLTLMPEARVTDMCAMLGVDQTTMSRNLALMARDGLIAGKQGADKREKRWSLMPAGSAAYLRARPLWAAAQKRLEEGWGEARLQRLRADLHELLDSLD